MPITKTTGYLASDGKVYTTVDEAQHAELVGLINNADFEHQMIVQNQFFATQVLKHCDAILAILTTGPRSRPAARKRAGTTNPKRATRAQAQAGFKAMRDAASGGTNAAHDADVAAEPAAA